MSSSSSPGLAITAFEKCDVTRHGVSLLAKCSNGPRDLLTALLAEHDTEVPYPDLERDLDRMGRKEPERDRLGNPIKGRHANVTQALYHLKQSLGLKDVKAFPGSHCPHYCASSGQGCLESHVLMQDGQELLHLCKPTKSSLRLHISPEVQVDLFDFDAHWESDDRESLRRIEARCKPETLLAGCKTKWAEDLRAKYRRRLDVVKEKLYPSTPAGRPCLLPEPDSEAATLKTVSKATDAPSAPSAPSVPSAPESDEEPFPPRIATATASGRPSEPQATALPQEPAPQATAPPRRRAMPRWAALAALAVLASALTGGTAGLAMLAWNLLYPPPANVQPGTPQPAPQQEIASSIPTEGQHRPETAPPTPDTAADTPKIMSANPSKRKQARKAVPSRETSAALAAGDPSEPTEVKLRREQSDSRAPSPARVVPPGTSVRQESRQVELGGTPGGAEEPSQVPPEPEAVAEALLSVKLRPEMRLFYPTRKPLGRLALFIGTNLMNPSTGTCIVNQVELTLKKDPTEASPEQVFTAAWDCFAEYDWQTNKHRLGAKADRFVVPAASVEDRVIRFVFHPRSEEEGVHLPPGKYQGTLRFTLGPHERASVQVVPFQLEMSESIARTLEDNLRNRTNNFVARRVLLPTPEGH